MSSDTSALVRFVRGELRAAADPTKAGPMADYLKTTMPFYGVQKPEREPIFREMVVRFPPANSREYQSQVLALWNLPHREEKYAAITYAKSFNDYIRFPAVRLYERLIREGAWWDFVDGVASDLVGTVLLNERSKTRVLLKRWIDDDDLWIRRAAILSQLGHKDKTDQRMLFDFCLRRAHESEFFVRKAIGWALRQYSYTNPAAVRDFLRLRGDRLSQLTIREAGKQLARVGMA